MSDADHDIVNVDSTGPDTADSVDASEHNPSLTRRRILKAGLITLPVLLTVHSRPAFAQSLGSLGIDYGAYLTRNNREILDNNGNIVPVLPNGHTNFNDDEVLIMTDPSRRTGGTMTYDEWRESQ